VLGFDGSEMERLLDLADGDAEAAGVWIGVEC
jgi:hypothetical protein